MSSMRSIIRLPAVLLLVGCLTMAQHLVEDINDPEQHFLYATGLLKRKFYDLAQPQLQLFLDRYPDHLYSREAHHLLVRCCYARGRMPDTLAAIASFRQRWPADSLNEQLLVIKATILFQQQDYLAASECFQELRHSQDPPTAESAIYHLAQCFLAREQPEDALEALKTLAERPLTGDFPYRPYAAYYLAEKALEKNDEETARAIFTRIAAGTNIPDKIKEESLRRAGDLHLKQQDYSGALQFYDDYLVSFPDGAASQYVRLQRLFCFFHLHNFEKVVHQAADWRRRFPNSDNVDLDMLQGDSLCALKRYEEALTLYWRSCENKSTPEQYRRHFLLQALECLHALQRYDELLTRGQELLQEFPNIPEKGGILFKMGQAGEGQQDWKQAENLYRQALEFYIGETDNYLIVANALLGCLRQARKWSEGAVVARRISEKISLPHQFFYRLEAADLESQLPNWAGVKSDCQFILQHFPEVAAESGDTLLLLVNASIALREYSAAREHLLTLQKIARPELQGRIALLLAEVLLNLSDNNAAVAVLEQASTLSRLQPQEKLEILVLLMRVQLSRNDEAAIFPLCEQILAWPDIETNSLITPLIWLEIGDCLRQKGKFTGALTAFRQAGKQTSEDQTRNSAAIKLGEIHLHLHQFAEAESVLTKCITTNLNRGFASSQELYSLLAETSYARQDYDQAFAAVEKCFSLDQDSNPRAATRARWVMARLLFEVENDPKNALPYSIRCFVLADDDLYSPKAMELAIRISLALGQKNEAKNTWLELQQRYPAAAAALQNAPYLEGW